MDICISVKSQKELNVRCHRKAKKGSKFCGYHCKCKNPILFNNPTSPKIYTEDVDIKIININRLKKTLKYHNIKYKNDENIRQLYDKLKYYKDRKKYIESKEKEIKIIQEKYKKYNLEKINKCLNDEDFYTLENLKEIDKIYFYSIIDNKKRYGFDIRSLYEYFNNQIKQNKNLYLLINPFTNIHFEEVNIDKINNRIKYLSNRNILKIAPKDKLTEKQKYNQYVLMVFQKFEQLGFLVEVDWFNNMKFNTLKTLYKKSEDMWNYRSELNMVQKSKIVNNGLAFTISVNYIMKLKPEYEHKLRILLLDEFYKLITEGESEADKKHGALLVLSALVEVSIDAANSYPWLIQI